MNKHKILLSLALATATAARADFNPVPLTPGSFTADVVVEASAPPPLGNFVTATMDGGTNNNAWVWYETGYCNNAQASGLPAAGSTFSAVDFSGHQWKMAPTYATNNVLCVYTAIPTGTITLTTPTAMNYLSVLAAGGGGGSTINFKVNYQGGGSQTGTLEIFDWFNNTPTTIAWNANGRVNPDNGEIGNLGGTAPKVFYGDLTLTDTVNPVTSVEFSSTSGNRAAIFALSSSLDGGTWTPLAISGYNRDMIIEAGAPLSTSQYSATTATMDGGLNNTDATFCEQGFGGFNDTGVPHAGASFSVGTHTWAMAPDFRNSDAMFISSAVPSGTLTIASPANFSKLSIVSAAAGGDANVSVTVHFADTSAESFTITVPDWYNTTQTPAWIANGRVNLNNMNVESRNDSPQHVRLFFSDITLGNTASAVTSVELGYSTGGRIAIFAVSGSADGTTFTPLTVTGYNQDVIVEASVPRYRNALSTATTVSMDGGTNNTGNTWYQQGYYKQFPSSGLPAPGSTITSLAQSDHHYQMPASYTANNGIFVDYAHPTANLTFASPATYSALSFLSATANGRVTNQCIMEYRDGTRETNQFISQDWFNNTPYAFTSLGRVDLNRNTINNDPGHTTTPNPRLYEAQFALGNTASPVTNVILQYLGSQNATSGRMVVLAVSATAGAVPPIISSVSPATLTTMEGSNVVITARITGGTEPISYQWQVGTNGVYVNLANGGNISGVTTTNLAFTSIGWTNTADYRLVASNVAGPVNSGIATLTVRSGLPDVTAPNNPITGFGGTWPAGESVGNSIDNTTTKYLNFLENGFPVGFEVTPILASTVTVLRFYTANDAEGRDPATYSLEGSNDDGATYSLISSNALALPGGRNDPGFALNPVAQNIQEIRIANAAAYKRYRMNFWSTKGDNIMQIGEVELLGVQSDSAPVLVQDLPPQVVAYPGRTLKLSVSYVGTTPITYQWKKNGIILSDNARITGSQSNVLTIANAQAGDVGPYQVFASNPLGGPVASSPTTVLWVTVPNFNTNGAGWTLNGAATVVDNVLTLTDGGGQARSCFFGYPQYVGAFVATFTYQDIGGGGADGFAFVLQNDPRGSTALGGGGGALALSGITPSAALTFNIYGTAGYSFGTNGNTGSPYQSSAPIDISLGNPIDVTVHYQGGVASLTLTDAVAAVSFQTNLLVNLPAIVGADTAYVGLTGASGGIASHQTVSNFRFVPLPTLSAHYTAGTVVLSWPAAIGGYAVLEKASLSTGTWSPAAAPITQSGGVNQAVIASPTGAQFYRLTLEPQP